MAATTTELGLVTPTQGDLSGSWGNTVNNGITEYTNIAIAGTLSFAGDGPITLANTTGSASGTNFTVTTAQYAFIRVTGTLTTAKIITAPSYSKTYMVENAATGSTVSFIRSGQTPAVSIAVGERAIVYYNGTDYVKVSSNLVTGLTGTLPVANGGTGLSSGTSGGILAYTASGTLASSAALTQYGVVYGGGAGAAPSATSAGTATYVLTSNGSGAAPTFQASSGVTTGKSIAMAMIFGF
jgi:hypothetical protein